MSTARILLWSYLDLFGTVVLLSAIFYVLEALVPAETKQPLSKRLFNLAYYAAILIALLAVNFAISPVSAGILQVADGGLVPKLISTPRGFLGQVLFALLFALVWDLWQYCVHRAQHALPMLWETHKFHHSETALNSSTQARHHLSHHLLMLLLYFPLIVLFGVLSPHAIAAFAMFRVWGFVNHANVRLHLGALTPIVAGPQWHRIHHSIHAEHLNKNFATFFPFIDILFGTYHAPQREEYPPTGIPGEAPVGDLREATVEPLFGSYQLLRNRFFVPNAVAKFHKSEAVPIESGTKLPVGDL